MLLTVAVTLFLVMDPLGNVPIYVSVLADVPPERRRRVLVRELLIALGVLAAFLLAGQAILDVFGFRAESISVAGGLVLLIIAIRMIFPAHGGEDDQPDSEPLIVPLAIPLVAGPSALATLILLRASHPDALGTLALALGIAWGATAAILMTAEQLRRLLGRRGLIALERLMGMLLVILAVQMFLDGVAHYLGR